MSIDCQSFDLSGSHYEMGRVQGARTEPFVSPAWWPPPPALDFARACASLVHDIHPPLLDELHGYAEAQQLPYEEVLRGVCRRSMRLRVPAAPAYPEGGCSSLAWVDARRHVRVGRNYDFHPVQRIRQRLRLRPDRGRASVGMRGSVPGGRYDGVNDAGLFACLHVALSAEPEEFRPGIPFHLLPRLVLETCASTRQARDLLTGLPHLHPFNYLIADARGEMCVVEAHPERVRVIEPAAGPHGGRIAATNHFRHADLREFQRGRKQVHSQTRLEFMYAGSTPEETWLADHASNLCGHAGGHTTLWSLTADLTARTIAYASGAPCQTAYEPVPWPGTNA